VYSHQHSSLVLLSHIRLSLKYVAEGGSVAEEVISTIRTAQAFGTQAILASLYDTFITGSSKVDMKAAVWHGSGLGVFFFVIYASYALGENRKSPFCCVILNCHQLSLLGRHLLTMVGVSHN